MKIELTNNIIAKMFVLLLITHIFYSDMETNTFYLLSYQKCILAMLSLNFGKPPEIDSGCINYSFILKKKGSVIYFDLKVVFYISTVKHILLMLILMLILLMVY